VIDKKGNYELSADVYSYGICLWELITGEYWPQTLREINPAEDVGPLITKEKLRPPINGGPFTPALRDLLEHCFHPDLPPSCRYTFRDIIAKFEANPAGVFPALGPSVPRFTAYQKRLNDAGIEAPI
jgi:serine/threonine protein kinase